MAEEDVVWGKNRHFFGGIEPSNMSQFTAKSFYDYTLKVPRIKITAKLPSDTVIDGQTLCTVAGAVIRKSTDGYPENEFDGELFADITEDGELLDTDVEFDTTYYYSAFPYTEQGVYNRNKANRSEGIPKTHTYLFGYDLVRATSTSAERVTYPEDVDNYGYDPVQCGSTATAGNFDYGSWNIEPGEKFMPRPCMLTYNGKVDVYLNPDDYTLNEDGSASRVADTTFQGNAMIEWGKIYTHREEVDGVYSFRCSDVPLGDDWDCWCNYDIENHVIDHFYTPAYFGSLINKTLRSISGQSCSVSTTADTEITYAKANGDDWYTEVAVDRFLINDLLVMMGKSTNLQLVYGYGRCNTSNTSAISNGTMNAYGFFWGTTANQTSGVKVFGMENYYGNTWRRTAGWINDNGTQKIKMTRGTHDGSTAEDYNTTGEGYIELADATPSGTSGGYISKMITTEYGSIPVTASGSSTTYEADGLWFNNAQVDYAFVGGDWDDGLLVGPFAVSLDSLASFAHSNAGASLSCKPLAS